MKIDPNSSRFSEHMRAVAIHAYRQHGGKTLYHASRALPVLHHEWIGGNKQSNDDKTILFLHGLLGNGKNLKTLAKKVVTVHNSTSNRDLATTNGLLLDLRGHGLSTPSSFQGPHTFDSCVQDVHTTLTPIQAEPSLVMGHSWGGRIALQYVHSLLKNGNKSLPQLWLLDTVPGQAHDSVLQVLNAVERINFTNKSRSDIAHELINHGLDSAIAQWLASTLQQDNETKLLKWGFGVDVVRELMPEFQNQDFVGLLQEILKEGGNVHLVKGGLNQAWQESPRIETQLLDLQETYSWQFQQHTLDKAGHWVHVDDLPGLINIVQDKA